MCRISHGWLRMYWASWNTSEKSQDWSHCRDDCFRTWTCKVCDNVSFQKELWRTTMEKSIFRTRNCKQSNRELVLGVALKNYLLDWWEAFKGFKFVNFVINYAFKIKSWQTTSFVTIESFIMTKDSYLKQAVLFRRKSESCTDYEQAFDRIILNTEKISRSLFEISEALTETPITLNFSGTLLGVSLNPQDLIFYVCGFYSVSQKATI